MEQVILEGVYALHPNIRPFLNLWVAVVMTSFAQGIWLQMFTNKV
jgi:hypothetical protein